MQHTFFVHFFAVVLHDYNIKLPETSLLLLLLWRKCRTCSRSLFFTTAHFHLALVAASISYFLNAATKLLCCSFNKKMSPLLFISRSRSLSPFFSLSFAGMPPTFSFSLSFSCSIFQISGHDNYSLSLILQTTQIQKQFPLSVFVFIDSLVASFYKTRVAMRFPAKIPSTSIWFAIPVDWVILPWYSCGTDGGSVARSVGSVALAPNFLEWVDLLSYGVPHARSSRLELRYKVWNIFSFYLNSNKQNFLLLTEVIC